MSKNSVLLSLGSNIDSRKNLKRAVRQLAASVPVESASRVFLSRGVGKEGMPDFLNAAVEVRTPLAPGELKYGLLREIEARLGRKRSADRNAPRPIDLDIALYGDEVIECEPLGLIVPDPEILTRVHVALPLADLAPRRRHPMTGKTLRSVAKRLEAKAGDDAIRRAPRSGFLRKLLESA